MKGKIAVSDVVATVLLILLTVAAAAALVGFIKPFVEKGLDDSTRCSAYSDYVEFEDRLDNGTGIYNYNCKQEFGKYSLIGISLKTDTNLTAEQLSAIRGFSISFNGNSSGEVITLSDGPKNKTLWLLGNKSANIKINRPLETVTYVYNTTKSFNSAEVYVVLDSGGCKVSDSIKLNLCNEVNLNV